MSSSAPVAPATLQPPPVDFDNRDAVYEYYRTHRPSRLRAQLSHAILAYRKRPVVGYADDARESIRALIRADRRLIIAINHLSVADPRMVAACAWRSVFRPRIGRIRVLAKDELFTDPEQRARIDTMGAIPVFRGKDHGPRAAYAAGQQLMEVCVQRMVDGDDLALFPEGTCNETDPTRVQTIGTGIGHIAARARKAGAAPAFVFLGLSYGSGTGASPRATFHIDRPLLDYPDRPAQITRLIAERMQRALDGAVAAAR
ncbi:1-acyl-sn-glycerol-3-phosphate acyltransferase [Nocardia veterana]|uniref:1-acyl-sn-glycerol-3-phosphate acyltransferase n=1 Tax=Nocardia veterana TaxID=132249 RepID=A0A7X6RIM9_9NOCA|nr:1-acyl-sn-glycerol-3-phosphate acyltransferase [Nocardia veterana]NKY87352.1 1-acyl-sn-glycerol-3-phosphate acyltransferase [Nocardia veterana]